jgi:hypothetical protein
MTRELPIGDSNLYKHHEHQIHQYNRLQVGVCASAPGSSHSNHLNPRFILHPGLLTATPLLLYLETSKLYY